MSTTLIGMFDSAEDAAQVRQHLIQSGIPAGQIDIHPSSTGTSGGSSTATTDHDKSWWQSLKDAFTGDDDYETSGGTRITADHYAEGVRRGSTVLRAEVPDDRVDAAITIMRQYNVVDINHRASQWQQSGWKGYDVNAKRFSNEEITAERARYKSTAHTGTAAAATTGQQEVKVPVVEEQLAVGKRRVEQGGVRIIRRATERPVQANVNLREEQVHVERHRVDRPASPADVNAAMKDQKIEVTASSEVPVVSKEARVVEEVVVNKTAQERQETVRDTVKRTDVEVERTPGQETTRTDKTSTQGTTGRTQQERNRQP